MRYGVKKTIIRKTFDSDPVFADKNLKTKVKPCNNKITTNYHGKAPKEGMKCVCLSALVINSLFKQVKKFLAQTFLEECKYKKKEREKEKNSLIKDDLENFFDDYEETSK